MYMPLLTAAGDTKTVTPSPDSSATEVEGESVEGGGGFASLLTALGEMLEGVDTPLHEAMAATDLPPLEKGLAELSAIPWHGLGDALPSLGDEALGDLATRLQDLLQALTTAAPGEDTSTHVLDQIESLTDRIGQWLEQSPTPALATLQGILQTLGEEFAAAPEKGEQLSTELGGVLARWLGSGTPDHAKGEGRDAGGKGRDAGGEGRDAGGKQLPQTASSPAGLAGSSIAATSEPSPLLDAIRSGLKVPADQDASQHAGAARDISGSRPRSAEGIVSAQLKDPEIGDTPTPSRQAEIDLEGLIRMPESMRLHPTATALQGPMDSAATATHLSAAAPIPGTQANVSLPAGTAQTLLPTTGTALQTLLPTIGPSPGESAWSQALGERVLWMAGRDMQQAEVRLNPPQLGPVEIRVRVHNDQASVSFVAQHPFTREALETSIPRLREMLGDANINLADVDVGQRDTRESGFGQDDREGSNGDGGDGWQAGTDVHTEDHKEAPTRIRSGLVDDFA